MPSQFGLFGPKPAQSGVAPPGQAPPQANLNAGAMSGPGGAGGAATAQGAAQAVPPDAQMAAQPAMPPTDPATATVSPEAAPAAPGEAPADQAQQDALPLMGEQQQQQAEVSGWQPGVTGSPLYMPGQGPITGQVPKMAALSAHDALVRTWEDNLAAGGGLLLDGTPNRRVCRLKTSEARTAQMRRSGGSEKQSDALSLLGLQRVAARSRKNRQDGEPEDTESESQHAPTSANFAESSGPPRTDKLANLRRSAVGEGDFEFKEAPWSVQGDAAWPGPDEMYTPPSRWDSTITPKKGKTSTKLSASAQGFLRECIKRGMTAPQIVLAAKEASSYSDRVAEDLGPLIKAANPFAIGGKWLGKKLFGRLIGGAAKAAPKTVAKAAPKAVAKAAPKAAPRQVAKVIPKAIPKKAPAAPVHSGLKGLKGFKPKPKVRPVPPSPHAPTGAGNVSVANQIGKRIAGTSGHVSGARAKAMANQVRLQKGLPGGRVWQGAQRAAGGAAGRAAGGTAGRAAGGTAQQAAAGATKAVPWWTGAGNTAKTLGGRAVRGAGRGALATGKALKNTAAGGAAGALGGSSVDAVNQYLLDGRLGDTSDLWQYGAAAGAGLRSPLGRLLGKRVSNVARKPFMMGTGKSLIGGARGVAQNIGGYHASAEVGKSEGAREATEVMMTGKDLYLQSLDPAHRGDMTQEEFLNSKIEQLKQTDPKTAEYLQKAIGEIHDARNKMVQAVTPDVIRGISKEMGVNIPPEADTPAKMLKWFNEHSPPAKTIAGFAKLVQNPQVAAMIKMKGGDPKKLAAILSGKGSVGEKMKALSGVVDQLNAGAGGAGGGAAATATGPVGKILSFFGAGDGPIAAFINQFTPTQQWMFIASLASLVLGGISGAMGSRTGAALGVGGGLLLGGLGAFGDKIPGVGGFFGGQTAQAAPQQPQGQQMAAMQPLQPQGPVGGMGGGMNELQRSTGMA